MPIYQSHPEHMTRQFVKLPDPIRCHVDYGEGTIIIELGDAINSWLVALENGGCWTTPVDDCACFLPEHHCPACEAKAREMFPLEEVY